MWRARREWRDYMMAQKLPSSAAGAGAAGGDAARFGDDLAAAGDSFFGVCGLRVPFMISQCCWTAAVERFVPSRSAIVLHLRPDALSWHTRAARCQRTRAGRTGCGCRGTFLSFASSSLFHRPPPDDTARVRFLDEDGGVFGGVFGLGFDRVPTMAGLRQVACAVT